ncbi:MAG: manganese efflux pump MntP family protein [Cellulosilyticaceae bacterium]
MGEVGILTMFATAVALSADAFAVSLTCGLALEDKSKKLNTALRAGLAFGIFQGGMTFLGWILGLTFKNVIMGIDHWVAFVLLSIIGIKMIKEAFDEESDKNISLDSFKLLMTLAVATSIDALAVGISFSVLQLDIMNITIGASLIGIITLVLSMVGVFIGNKLGNNTKLQSKVNIIGGIVLVAIGIKILLQHILA